ncbi:hypothetical protein EV426DRAFT_231488 [Tirmania nivea]|nr:hypothetical protein EV426DRAFT_231488 [Tirmania nivea]
MSAGEDECMRTERHQQLSLINLPPEITCIIVDYLTAYDFITLRLVSKTFLDYFTKDDICRYAHKVYFSNSSEVTGKLGLPYPGFQPRPFIEGGDYRMAADFDNSYVRNLKWKTGQPTDVEIIDPVADGSVGCLSSIMVEPREELIVYQKSCGILCIRDINKQEPEAVTTLDLKLVLGDCIVTSSPNLTLQDGQRIRMRLNRGRLFLAGEAHDHHPLIPEVTPISEPNKPNRWGWLWPWTSSDLPPEISTMRQRVPYSTHTQCAVLSVRPEDRGRLIAKWYEVDNFLTIAALNEHYCISEFHLIEQRLEGVIYRTEESTTPNYEPAHHFSVRKKTEYPPLSTFDIAADTKGKVFYLGFLPPPDRRPVVEVISIPKKTQDDTWTEPTVLKRVVLRTLAKHLESSGAALLRSYWIDFDDGIEVSKDMCAKKEGKNWKLGEDIVRLRLRGDFIIRGTTPQDECVKLVSWYITARPSPGKPPTIQEWRSQRHEPLNNEVSLWTDATGHVDLEECYPIPTYYTMAYNREGIRALPLLPKDLDIDREVLYPFPWQYWHKNAFSRDTIVSSVFCAEGMQDSTENLNYTEAPSNILEYPQVPGRDDHDFVPPGRHLYAVYRAVLETDRPVTSKRIRGRALAAYKIAKKKGTCLDGLERISDRVWEDYKAAAARDLDFERGPQRPKNIRDKAAQAEEEEEEARSASQGASVHLPPPGGDYGGLRSVFDWNNRRCLVYGKSGYHRRFGLREDIDDGDVEKSTERIVIVRYD